MKKTRPLIFTIGDLGSTNLMLQSTADTMYLAPGQPVIVRLSVLTNYPIATDRSHDNEVMFTIAQSDLTVDAGVVSVDPLHAAYLFGDLHADSAHPNLGKITFASYGSADASPQQTQRGVFALVNISRSFPGIINVTGNLTIGEVLRVAHGPRTGYFT